MLNPELEDELQTLSMGPSIRPATLYLEPGPAFTASLP